MTKEARATTVLDLSEISTRIDHRCDQQRKLPLYHQHTNTTTSQLYNFLLRRVLTSQHVHPFHENGIRIMQNPASTNAFQGSHCCRTLAEGTLQERPEAPQLSKITPKLQDRTRQCRSMLTWPATRVCSWEGAWPPSRLFTFLPMPR